MEAIRQTAAEKARIPISLNKPANIRWVLLFTLTGLFGLACASYWSIMNNGPVADDWGLMYKIAYIPNGELWRLFLAQSPLFVRPIPFFAVWLLYHPFGLNFMPSHFLSVGLHAVNAFLLLWLLTELGVRYRTGLAASLLFLAAPINAQAVSWATGRFDVLALLFMLLSLGLYASYLRRGKSWRFALAVFAAAAAWLSKEPSMIMIGLIPALEIIFLFMPPAAAPISAWPQRWRAALKPAAVRLGILYVLFAGYIAMRYAIMGRLGGAPYVPLFGKPSFGAIVQSIKTFLAPLDDMQSSKEATILLAGYVGVLYVLSLGLVILHWKQASRGARRSWVFIAASFAASLVPIYAYIFMPGFAGGLGYSRMFYISYAAFISLMAIGLLEFGWQVRLWRAGISVALLALVPIFITGLYHNNRVWENQAVVSSTIARQIQAELPDPPYGAKLYFGNVPRLEGGHIFASAMPETVQLVYGRRDVQAYYVNPDPDPWMRRFFKDSANEAGNGFLFNFDWSTRQLTLVRGPLSR